MKFDPNICPECGNEPVRILDLLFATAKLTSKDGVVFEYTGYTDPIWDTQTSVVSPNDHITLFCNSGHDWQAFQS